MVIKEQLPSLRKWAANQLHCEFGDCITLANMVEGQILAVVVFHNFRKTSCEISIASVSPRWGSRLFIREVFSLGFATCRRILVLVAVDNQVSIDLVERLGFKREGLHRQAADDGTDLYSYAMLKQECRWING